MSQSPRHRERQPSSPRSQAYCGRRGALVAVGAAVCVFMAGMWLLGESDLEAPRADGVPVSDATALPPSPAPETAAGDTWRRVLVQLSHRRSSIWQRSTPVQLNSVFVAGSSVLRRDRIALRSYSDRGLRIESAEMIFSPIEQVTLRRSTVRLVVVDRLAGVMVSNSSEDLRALPRDKPTRHEVLLRHTSQGWRIARISRVAS